MNNTDPLPCPFCGYSDVEVSIEHCDWGHFGRVMCNICGATAHGIGVMIPKDGGPADELTASALEAWNTRTEPQT